MNKRKIILEEARKLFAPIEIEMEEKYFVQLVENCIERISNPVINECELFLNMVEEEYPVLAGKLLNMIAQYKQGETMTNMNGKIFVNNKTNSKVMILDIAENNVRFEDEGLCVVYASIDPSVKDGWCVMGYYDFLAKFTEVNHDGI